MDVEKLLREIIIEAKIGKVLLDGDTFPISFNTIIRNGDKEEEYINSNNLSTLVIEKFSELCNLITEYLNIEDQIGRKCVFDGEARYKQLISYLFVNATTEDFLRPNELVKRNIAFLKDHTLEDYNQPSFYDISTIIPNSYLIIRNFLQSTMQETPYVMTFHFQEKDDGAIFNLPDISYGIKEENGKKVCYIYGIQRKDAKNGENEPSIYHKKVNRLLYKIDGNVRYFMTPDEDESIKDVSDSAVLSLYLFINMIKQRVDMIKGAVYLPVRYNSRAMASGFALSAEERKNLQERNDMIQRAITNKFIRTFRRVALHTDFLEIDLFPYDMDEFLHCSFNGHHSEKINSEFIDEIDRKVK